MSDEIKKEAGLEGERSSLDSVVSSECLLRECMRLASLSDTLNRVASALDFVDASGNVQLKSLHKILYWYSVKVSIAGGTFHFRLGEPRERLSRLLSAGEALCRDVR